MYTLLYSSRSKQRFPSSELEELARFSAYKNTHHRVTRFLLYSDGYFLPLLEGEEKNVLHISNKIKNDPRHEIQSNSNSLANGKRLFPKWRMKYIHDLNHKSISPDVKELIISHWRNFLPERDLNLA